MRFGYDLRLSGTNPEAALSSGVNPKKMVLITLFMSGAVAGMIGLPFLMADPDFLKYGDAFPTMLGFTGLGIALLGRNNPAGIAAAALVWATIERATQRLGPIGVPPEIGRILQGSFLLAAVIAYEVVRRRNDAAAAAAAAQATHDERQGAGGDDGEGGSSMGASTPPSPTPAPAGAAPSSQRSTTPPGAPPSSPRGSARSDAGPPVDPSDGGRPR